MCWTGYFNFWMETVHLGIIIMIWPWDDLKFPSVAGEGLLPPLSEFKRAVRDKKTKQKNPQNSKTNFTTKPCEFCMFSVLITHVSSSIKRGPVREELKLHWEHPLERPCVMNGGWESIWTKLAEVWVWALEQEVILRAVSWGSCPEEELFGLPSLSQLH